MATCTQLITLALRKLGAVESGVTPTTPETTDALELLQSLYSEWISKGRFGRLTNILIEGDYTAKENERIAYTGGATGSITLPTTIALDGAEADPDSSQTYRAPKDMSVVVIAGTTPQQFIYDADYGDWIALESLSGSSYAPLSNRYRSYLASELAVRYATEFSLSVPPGVALEAAEGRSAFTHKPSAELADPAYF